MRLLLPLLFASAAAARELPVELLAAELARDFDEALFRQALDSGRAQERRLAARAIGRIRDPRGTALLLPLLRDADAATRREALFALGALGSREHLVPIREALPRLGEEELPAALLALGRTGDPRALPLLASHLRKGPPEVRGAAALGLFRLGDASALPDLLSAAAAATPGTEGAWKPFYAIGRLARAKPPVDPPPAWAEVLAGGCDRARPFEERVFATLALGAVAPDHPLLRALLRDADPRVVVAAARALSKPWRAEVAAEVGERLRGTEDPLLRETLFEHVSAGAKEALALLGAVEGAMAAPPRLRLLHATAFAAAGGEPAWLRDATAAERALPEFEEALWRCAAAKGAIPDRWPATGAGAAAAAEALGEPAVPAGRAVPRLRELLLERDFVLRATAVASIGRRKDPSLAPLLVEAAERSPGVEYLDVRVEAASALKALGVFDPWLERAAASDPQRPVRVAAREALEALGRTPPRPPASAGFRVRGRGAVELLREARALAGARLLLETERGTIEILLLPDEAPAHCATVAALARSGFYDGLAWHRVVADFVIQGGCPRGDGSGGPGYLLPDEIGTRPYVRGTVGMPKSVDDTGGCQIFITHLPTPHLDGRYTVFGQVVSGFEVVDRIRVGDRLRKATLLLDPPG